MQSLTAYSLMCAVSSSIYSKTFDIFSSSALCSAVSGPKRKGSYLLYISPLFFFSCLDPEHSLSGFLLSAIFLFVCVNFYLLSNLLLSERAPVCCLILLLDWRGDLGLLFPVSLNGSKWVFWPDFKLAVGLSETVLHCSGLYKCVNK